MGAEVEQHRLLDPLVRDPALLLLFSDAQAAGVQLADDLLERAGQNRPDRRGEISDRRSNASSMTPSSPCGAVTAGQPARTPENAEFRMQNQSNEALHSASCILHTALVRPQML
jgi:hypothetical protein